MRLLDWLVFAALAVVALIGGVNALWIDKQFGGPLDWLLAFAWGAGSTAVTGVLAGAYSNLRKTAVISGGL
jgi:hypothetical protein